MTSIAVIMLLVVLTNMTFGTPDLGRFPLTEITNTGSKRATQTTDPASGSENKDPLKAKTDLDAKLIDPNDKPIDDVNKELNKIIGKESEEPFIIRVHLFYALDKRIALDQCIAMAEQIGELVRSDEKKQKACLYAIKCFFEALDQVNQSVQGTWSWPNAWRDEAVQKEVMCCISHYDFHEQMKKKEQEVTQKEQEVMQKEQEVKQKKQELEALKKRRRLSYS